MAALEIARNIAFSAATAGNPVAADMPRTYDASTPPQGAIVEVVNYSPVRLDFNNPSVTIFQQEAPASPFLGPSAEPSIVPELSPSPNPVTGELPCPTPTPIPERTEPPFPSDDPNIGHVNGEVLAQTGTDVIISAQEEPTESIDPAPSPTPDPEIAGDRNCAPEPSLEPRPTLTPKPPMKDLNKLTTGEHPNIPFNKVAKRIERYFSNNPDAEAKFVEFSGWTPSELIAQCKTERDMVYACSQIVESEAYAYAATRYPELYDLIEYTIDSVVNIKGMPNSYPKYINDELDEVKEENPQLFS